MTNKKFPSPFGVRVLKFVKVRSKVKRQSQVSVPFRGSCSEIYQGSQGLTALLSFRPLSGFVF